MKLFIGTRMDAEGIHGLVSHTRLRHKTLKHVALSRATAGRQRRPGECAEWFCQGL